MRGVTRSFIICCAAGSLSALPMILPFVFGFWAPAGIIWETFGVHYTAYPTLALNYHFISNAMSFAVLYAYAPSYVVHEWMAGDSDFQKDQIYLVLVYGIHAAAMVAVCAWIAFKPFSLAGKLCLILVAGILPLWVANSYINILSVNYFWMAAPLYLIAATLWVLAVRRDLEVGTGLAAFIGAALAAAIWTKFTYAVSIGMFLVLPILFAKQMSLWRTGGILTGCFVGASIVFCVVYFVGHPEYAVRFYDDLLIKYSADYLFQNIPELWDELDNWPRISSAIQTMTMLAGITTIAGAVRAAREPSLALWIFLLAVVGVGALFVPFIVARTAGNTFADAIIFLCFVIGVWIALFVDQPRWRSAGWALFVLFLGLTVWQVFGVFGFAGWIEKLQAATLSGREVDGDIHQRRDLPVVYYWLFPNGRGPIWHGPPLWPSPYLYALASGPQETKRVYLEKYFPGTSHRAILDGPLPSPHVMVVQEYLTENSPLHSRVFGVYPEFDAVLRKPANTCRRHDVAVAWTDFAMPDKSTITVCVVK